MDPQFQRELTLAIVGLTPGMILLALLALVGLLMILEKAGVLASFARSAPPAARKSAAAATTADVKTAPADKPADPTKPN